MLTLFVSGFDFVFRLQGLDVGLAPHRTFSFRLSGLQRASSDSVRVSAAQVYIHVRVKVLKLSTVVRFKFRVL